MVIIDYKFLEKLGISHKLLVGQSHCHMPLSIPAATLKRQYRPIWWKSHHLGYKQGIELETPPSLGEKIGKAALPRVLPFPLEILQCRRSFPIPCRRGRE